jgi:hypothetical protein
MDRSLACAAGVMWLGSRVIANVAESAVGVLAVCEAGGAEAVVCALEVHLTLTLTRTLTRTSTLTLTLTLVCALELPST